MHERRVLVLQPKRRYVDLRKHLFLVFNFNVDIGKLDLFKKNYEKKLEVIFL